jgi:hypothetical protein
MMAQKELKTDLGEGCLTCTWDDEARCYDCEIKDKLDCRWDKNLLMRFYKGGSIAMISGTVGLVIVGLFVSWIPLIIYAGFWIFFFGFFEIRVLCSHCPYYSEDGNILHCLANHGTIKLWKYNPRPMNLWEKLGFLGGALFFVVFPVIGEIYGVITILNRSVQEGLTISLGILIILSIFGGIYFFRVLVTRICPHCVNFSCPLNQVPKEIVDSYLMRNPIMKEAWEASGYVIGKNLFHSGN